MGSDGCSGKKTFSAIIMFLFIVGIFFTRLCRRTLDDE